MRSKGLVALLCLLALGPAGTRAAHAAGGLPRLESVAGEELTENDRQALTRWVLAQPEVEAHLGASRTRLLRLGADLPKDDAGEEYRRATFFLRNYDSGLTHAVYVQLATGEIRIQDLTSAVQPNREEIEAALAVIGRDRELAPLLSDPAIHVTGGFYGRSPVREDPCSHDVCVLVELMHAGHGNGFANRVVVNLSRETIANRHYRSSPDPKHPLPMTDLGGN